MTRDDLARFYHTWFKPNNGTLLIVGDTTLAEMRPLLEKAFAGWKPGEVPKKTVAQVGQPAHSVVYLMDRPGSQQSVIVGAQLAPPRNSPDAVPLQVVNNIFGGTFSSRLNMNLREDKHWAYGANTVIAAAVGQRPFLSISPVQTDKTPEALHEAVNEYANIAGAKPITAAELKDAQDNETLRLPGSFETASQLSGAYSTILQYQLPDDYYNTFTEKTLALTPEQANALAAKTVTPGKMIWLVVGDLSKIESGVRALNLGEVHQIDVNGNLVK
jgi:zinc protease